MAEDGAMACAEAIFRFYPAGPVLVDDRERGLRQKVAGIIRAYRDREVAEALAEQAKEVERLEQVRENWIASCGDATRRALAAEARVAEQAGEIEQLRSHIEHALNTLGAGRSDVARTFEILRAATNG